MVGNFLEAPFGAGGLVTVFDFFIAAALLSLERLTYAWVWHHPREFRDLAERFAFWATPVDALNALFWIFKIIQCSVFVAWCASSGSEAGGLHGGTASDAFGAVLLVAGQILNFAVFYRLGQTGVFYGNRLGHHVPWCHEFPFSVLKHPQYVGAVLSIWGFFLVVRFPYDDWFVLPALETVYYAAGAYLEQ